MIQVGITQRVEIVAAYNERRDCLDQRWPVLLSGLDLIGVPIANSLCEPAALINGLRLSGFILTGGNDLAVYAGAEQQAKERDETERIILSYAQEHELPVLGVCRGMQVINHFFGGSMRKVKGHVNNRHFVKVTSEDISFAEYNQVNSYHCWGIFSEGVGRELQVAVYADDGTVEAFYHQALPWIGIMWHPEREESFSRIDRALIKGLFGAKEGGKR